MLGLDQDLSAFYEAARHEPKLASAAMGARGPHPAQPHPVRGRGQDDPDHQHHLGQHQADGRQRRGAFRRPASRGPGPSRVPDPGATGRERRGDAAHRRETGLPRAVCARPRPRRRRGALDLETLRTAALSTPELRKRLLALKGVGPYAAANLLMLLARYDAIPIDSWALTVVSREWHGGAPVGPAEVEAAFAHCGMGRGGPGGDMAGRARRSWWPRRARRPWRPQPVSERRRTAEHPAVERARLATRL